MPNSETIHDVIVIGGGNAGLCAALRARETVDDVIVLEKAPEGKRGGNSFFTEGRMRIPHGDIEDVAKLLRVDLAELANIEIESYSEDDFYNDLQRASRYLADEPLCRLIAAGARPGVEWLQSMGSKFHLALGFDDIKSGEKIKLIGGDDLQHYEGGPGLVNALISQLDARGVPIHYDTGATRLLRGPDGVEGVEVRTADGVVDTILGRTSCSRAVVSRPARTFAMRTSARVGPGEGSRHRVQHGGRPDDGDRYRCTPIRALGRLPFGFGRLLRRPFGDRGPTAISRNGCRIDSASPSIARGDGISMRALICAPSRMRSVGEISSNSPTGSPFRSSTRRPSNCSARFTGAAT